MSISIYEISPRPANEAQREQAVIRSGALDANGHAELQTIVDRAGALLGASKSAVSIVFRDSQYLIAAKGISPGAYRRSTSFCGHAIMTPREVFIVPDTMLDARFAGNPVVVDEPGLRFYAGAPLLDTQGLPLGVLCVVDNEPRAGVTAEQAAGLTTLAGEVVALLHRVMLVSDMSGRMHATG